jgi:hypothetical protein
MPAAAGEESRGQSGRCAGSVAQRYAKGETLLAPIAQRAASGGYVGAQGGGGALRCSAIGLVLAVGVWALP